ncbi:MAG: mechanosensitive ion channel family protein [Acidobacteriota bacterium]
MAQPEASGEATAPTAEALGQWEQLAERYIPFWNESTILQLVLIVTASLLVAKLVQMVVIGLLKRWARKTESDLDDHALAALSPAIYITVIAIGLRVGVGRLGLNEALTERIADVLATIVLLFWAIGINRVCQLILTAVSRMNDRFQFVSRHTLPIFENVSKVLLFLGTAYGLILIWNGDVSGLLAAGGVAGLAVGFAARDTLANLFAGVFILADRPYKVGDFINLDTGERGMVTDIGIRSTRLLTRDDVEITIPNAVMGNAKIINESGGPHVKYRLRVKVGVSYESDVDQVRAVLEDIAAQAELVCAAPSPRVRLRQLGESSVDFELLCWVDEPVLRGRAYDDLYCSILKRFRAEGIEIPYAKRDVYVKEMPR